MGFVTVGELGGGELVRLGFGGMGGMDGRERGSYDLDGCGALGGELGGLEGGGWEGCFVGFSAMVVRGLDIVMMNLLNIGKYSNIVGGRCFFGPATFCRAALSEAFLRSKAAMKIFRTRNARIGSAKAFQASFCIYENPQY